MGKRSAVRRQTLPESFKGWKGASQVCQRCYREILKGDIVRYDEFYDDEGRFEALVHKHCDEVRTRTRHYPPPAPTFETVGGDYRRKVMATETIDQETTDEETTAKPKRSKKSKSKKKATKTKSSAKKEKATKSSKGKSKKAKKEKAADAGSDGRNSMANTIASRLEPFLGGNKNASPALKNLAKGDGSSVTHNQLVTLKDEVNKTATELRKEGKTDEASQLSATNALVRRLERAAR